MIDFRAIVHGACPRCRKGAIFRVPVWRGYLAMHERCPVCGHKFEREPGYFLGALYISYLVSIPPVTALMLIFWRLLRWQFDLSVVGAFVAWLPAVPVVTRMARVLWMYLDWHFDPD